MHEDRDGSAHRAAIEEVFERLVDLPEAAWPKALDDMADSMAPSVLAQVRKMLERLAARPDLLQSPAAASFSLEREIAAGSRLGRWIVQGRLGGGGQSLVLAVTRSEGGFEQAAVTKLPRGAGFERDATRRLLRERQVLARLNHRGLPAVLDGGVLDDGSPVLVIERIDGEPIDHHCDRRRLGLRARVELLVQVAEVLTHAHAQLVLHRDVKPANVLVESAADRVVLLDFGVAQNLDQEDSHTAAGYTLAFAAPEQVRGERGTVATDVYGLGALGLKLCSGQAPFEGLDTAARVQAVLAGDPPLPAELDSDLRAIFGCCLRQDAARRYASVDALRQDLLAWLHGRAVAARAGGRRYLLGKFLRRHRLPVAAATVVILLLGSSALYALHHAAESERARLQAEGHRQAAERSAQRALSINALFNQVLTDVGSRERQQQTLDPTELFDLIERRARESQYLPDARVDVLNQLAIRHDQAGRPQRSLALLQEALSLVQQLPPEQREPRFEAALWRSLASNYRWLQQPEPAMQALQNALDLLQPLPEAEVIADLSYLFDLRASLLADAGEVDAAIAARRDTLALVDRHGAAAMQRMFYAVSNLAGELRRAGRDGEALSLLQGRLRAMDAADAEAFPQGPAILKVQLGRVLRQRGQAAEALHWYTRGLDLREQHHDHGHFTFLHGRGERVIFELEAGAEAGAALAELRRIDADFESAGHPQDMTRGMIRAWRARAAAAAGEPVEAGHAFTDAETALARMPEGQQNIPDAWLHLLQAALALGDRTRTLQALDRLDSVVQRFYPDTHPLRRTSSAVRARTEGRADAHGNDCARLQADLQPDHLFVRIACG